MSLCECEIFLETLSTGAPSDCALAFVYTADVFRYSRKTWPNRIQSMI
jgi:hypothetical protein